jgi:vacuolar-type H+-ATPase subunit H
MKEVIKEVLQAEEKVNSIIEEARNKAAEIRKAADKEVSEKVRQAEQQAQEILKNTVEDSKKQAEQIRRERIEQGWHDNESLMQNNTDKINKLVDDICKLVLKTEFEKDN